MKKNYMVLAAVILSFASVNNIASNMAQYNAVKEPVQVYSADISGESSSIIEGQDTALTAKDAEKNSGKSDEEALNILQAKDTTVEKQSTGEEQKLIAANSEKSSKASAGLSRGGQPPVESRQAIENSKYGELQDWWKSAQYTFPIDSVAQVTDLYTGKTFSVKRTFGTNHADVETPTIEDTNIMKSIWGGFSWERRPVIVTINNKRLAASMTAMPHAGLDPAPALATVKNRSDGYGAGTNLDKIKGNGMDGVADIHFLNSTRHMDNNKDPQHQAAILKASGK